VTTQAVNLPGRIPAGPIYVQRFDGSAYCEADPEVIARMVSARVVEGVGPRSGRIDRLRIICTEEEAIQRLQAISESQPQEEPGSITTDASREIFREKLNEGLNWTWCHRRNRNMENATP
jgi:hypothetical protein